MLDTCSQQQQNQQNCTFETSARRMAGSFPEKSVGDAMNNLPFSVIRVVILACGLNGHFATPLSNLVIFRLSIWLLSIWMKNENRGRKTKKNHVNSRLLNESKKTIEIQNLRTKKRPKTKTQDKNIPDATNIVDWMHVYHMRIIDCQSSATPLHSCDSLRRWPLFVCRCQRLRRLLPTTASRMYPMWRTDDKVHR